MFIKKITLILLSIAIGNICFAQKVISQELYEGKINNDISISLYLKVAENGCPNIYAASMYKYVNVKNSKYIYCNTFLYEFKNEFTLVEHGNTGILILKRTKITLNGIWISSDGKKQLKVELKKVNINDSQKNALEKKYDEAQYATDDC